MKALLATIAFIAWIAPATADEVTESLPYAKSAGIFRAADEVCKIKGWLFKEGRVDGMLSSSPKLKAAHDAMYRKTKAALLVSKTSSPKRFKAACAAKRFNNTYDEYAAYLKTAEGFGGERVQ